jgi:hypothetical protein
MEPRGGPNSERSGGADRTSSPSRTYHRFDSLTALIDFCKKRYSTLDVVATTEDDMLVVRITPPGDQPFTRLVAHFEGERTYVIGLPEDGTGEER